MSLEKDYLKDLFIDEVEGCLKSDGDPVGTAVNTVSEHNTSNDAHSDIRLLIAGLTSRFNALADSDDTTLDQVSELVAYIKANRSLIEQITTGKVSVTDIINNLTTNVANRPLSASQGVVLKGLIDALQTAVNSSAANLSSHTGNDTVHITAAERTKWNQAVTDVGNLSEEIANQYAKKSAIPTKMSQLTNDSGYLTQHQDLTPYAKTTDLTAHTGNSTVHVTAEEKAAWNGKSNFSGSYNDLSDKPTIPTVPSKVSAFTNDAGYLTQHQDISGKANASDLTAHTENRDIHVTAAEKAAWNENALPSVSPSDSGKILMVNSSGVPAWTAITNAEGVSY